VTRLTRADLPAELTPESLRGLDLRRLGQLRRPNQVLTPTEQAQFDTAFDTVVTEIRERLQDADVSASVIVAGVAGQKAMPV
jgi:NifB/MoaA-like Fe-S oxidoreductase